MSRRTSGLTVSTRSAARWPQHYARRLLATDTVILAATVVITQWSWLGLGGAQVPLQPGERLGTLPYWLVSLVIIVLWSWLLSLVDSRDQRIIGSGFEEYGRLLRASFLTFGSIAIIAYLSRLELARGYVLIAFPAGTLLLVLSRWLWRQWLWRQRRRGRMLSRVLLVGSPASAAEIGKDLLRSSEAGFRVVAVTHVDVRDVPPDAGL